MLTTKITHSNVLLNVNYRTLRDSFAAEEEKKKEDNKDGDGDDKAAEDKGREGSAKEKIIMTINESLEGDDKKCRLDCHLPNASSLTSTDTQA